MSSPEETIKSILTKLFWLQSGFETVLLYKCELSLAYCTMNIDWASMVG